MKECLTGPDLVRSNRGQMTTLSRFIAPVCLILALSASVVVRTQQTPAPPASTAPPMPEVLQKYSPVTLDRLKRPADADWLMVRRTYDGWGFSPLRQITADNVSRLEPVWSFSTGAINGHEATPLVNNGVMFVATPGNQVIAINARTGALLWRYRNTPAPDVVLLHPTSRGVALYEDKVFFAQAEATLVALDARTGKPAWTAKVEDNRKGYYMSVAPLVAEGKVVVGASGGELGVRGFLAAYDVNTGKELWRTFTVPAPGEPGSETWPKGDQWKTGGGSIWVSGNYDPETHLMFWGTGNGGPWMGDQRPGDNL
jgi:alcohol dehydrogenase (cytochrome c)